MTLDTFASEWEETPPHDAPQEWPTPQPLLESTEPQPYPLDALPDAIKAAVCEVHDFVQAPVAMVATSAIAALSLVGQSHYDVMRAEKLTGPTGLYLLTIADSGERKSTCDGFFTSTVKEWEQKQREAYKPILERYKADHAAWEAERRGRLDAITKAGKDGKDTSRLKAELRDHEAATPEQPVVPRMIYADATQEALAHALGTGWPTGGLLSSEAGVIFGGHGMSKDAITRNLATLNVLWDADPLQVDRRGAPPFVLHGARLTIALQVQEPTLRDFFQKSGDLARGTGFLARFLLSWPESTQGSRPFKEPPPYWPALAVFHRRMSTLLEKDAPLNDEGRLDPPMMKLAPDTKRSWIAFHDGVESQLRAGGGLHDVRDVASKIADNAARLGALFQLFEDGSAILSDDNMARAIRITAWHLTESRRFFGELAIPDDEANVMRLDAWLAEHCQRNQTGHITRRDLQRNVTPTRLRNKKPLDDALKALAEAGRIRLIRAGRNQTVIDRNPALLAIPS